MVDFLIRNKIFTVGARETIPTAKGIDEEWFAEDIKVITSDHMSGATIVIDFSYSIPSVIEYTLDGGATWVEFNQGLDIMGGQSRYLRVTSGVQLNFRAKLAGTLNRVIVGEV